VGGQAGGGGEGAGVTFTITACTSFLAPLLASKVYTVVVTGFITHDPEEETLPTQL